ncbi:MAG: hypothetical protein WBO36_03645, partial [Saprospiraceae bacterium]
MKNLLTSLVLGIMAFLLFNTTLVAAHRLDYQSGHKANHNYVANPDRAFTDLFPWMESQASAMMMPCPPDVTLNLSQGKCDTIYNFVIGPLPVLSNIPDITASVNTDPNTIAGTRYCSFGETRYRRTFTHSGPTDLNLHTIRLGIYESTNSPDVTVNIYIGGNLISTTTNTITASYSYPNTGFFNFGL